MEWRLLDKLIALLGAMLAGVSIHYLSRALGLAETVPGVIVGTAFAAVALSAIHWKVD